MAQAPSRVPPSRLCRGVVTVENPAIVAPRLALPDRAGRWVTEQVGRCGRTVNEVAIELGCDWHTVNDAVIAYGSVLVDNPARIGQPTALGLEETLFYRRGPWRHQSWSTSIVDVGSGRLLDVVVGRGAAEPRWLAAREESWRKAILWATLDLSGPYRSVFDTMLPHATQVADPFHLLKLANAKLDECRRRVQNETLGHRGRKDDPLYRCRRLLSRADKRLDDRGHQVGRPARSQRSPRRGSHGLAREGGRGRHYKHCDAGLAVAFVERLGLISRTSPARSRCRVSVGPSSVGRNRSPPGIGPT